MTFIETLRAARTSRVAILHEFWAQYDASSTRLHLFVEGHDDEVFFRYFVERRTRSGVRIYVYRCDGKAKVFDAFAQIVRREPSIRTALFFVDKDVDDIVGVPWPTDPRVFVTDVYSIENYLSTSRVAQKFYRAAIKTTGVRFDEDVVLAQFERGLTSFRRMARSVMAWVIVHRHANARPNLSNVNLGELCVLNDDCSLMVKRGVRSQYLARVTGVPERPGLFRQIVPIARTLARMAPERVIRGKFEAWFVVEFWKKLSVQLYALAREGGGKVAVPLKLERSTFVAVLSHYAEMPESLDRFLQAHLSQVSPEGKRSADRSEARDRSFWERFVRRWTK